MTHPLAAELISCADDGRNAHIHNGLVRTTESYHFRMMANLRNAAAELDRLTAQIAVVERERDEATDFISRRGYRLCSIPACNCGSWHGGLAEDRLTEIREAMQEHGFNLNGRTFVQAIEETAAERDAARAELAQIPDDLDERAKYYAGKLVESVLQTEEKWFSEVMDDGWIVNVDNPEVYTVDHEPERPDDENDRCTLKEA